MGKNRLYQVAILSLLFTLGGCARDAGEQGSASDTGAASETGRLIMDENQNYADLGDFVVSVNAMTTDELAPEVAKAYGIPRSKSRAIINIALLKKDPDSPLATGIPVPGKVNSVTRNLTGQLKDMPLKEVNEQDAVYYIGQVPVVNGETLVFEIDAAPAGSSETLRVQYQQRFFTE